jgi:hypothetical protein
MKTLFPEMDHEIRNDRLAERREARQLARKTLAENKGTAEWVLRILRIKGPMSGCGLMLELEEIVHGSPQADVKLLLMPMVVCHALWLNRELWRQEIKNHPSGHVDYVFGIKGLHEKTS